MPVWSNCVEDYKRWLDGVPVVNKQSRAITEVFAKMAANDILSLSRAMGSELFGYSSFFYANALKQASADANEELKRLSELPITAQSLTEHKARAHKEALENAMEYCYKPLIEQAYRLMTAKECGTFSLPKPTVEVITVQEFNQMFFVILERGVVIQGYCPDGKGGDFKQPDFKFDPTISLDLYIISFEWNPITNEFELNLGQGIMVGMTWKPETGFGVQVGLGVHGKVGGVIGGEAAVWCRLDEGVLTVESELGGYIGLSREVPGLGGKKGSASLGFEITHTHATANLY